MKDWIETYIDENRDALDIQEAPPGHRARFEQKLDSRFGRERVLVIPLRSLGRVAATLLLLAAAGIWGSRHFFPADTPAATDPMFNEIAEYYSAQEMALRATLEQYPLDQYEFAHQIEQDLDELEAENDELRRLLRQEGPNDFLIESMTRNFEMRLELLKKMKALLNNIEKDENAINL